MAFTWTESDAVTGGLITAASVNEVRNLLDTMYSQINCSSRNTVVKTGDNSDYNITLYSSKIDCTTVYSSRHGSYCTSVDNSKEVLSYSGVSIGCTADNGGQNSTVTCDAHNAEKWSTHNTSNRTSYENSENLPYNSGQRSGYNEGDCSGQYGECTGNTATCSADCRTRAGCTSANGSTYTSYRESNWTSNKASQYGSNDYSDKGFNNDSYYVYDDGSDHTSRHSQYACSAQNSSRYGSKVVCSGRNNALYSGRQSANKAPDNAAVRVCNTEHSGKTT